MFACAVAENALLAERAAGREPDPRSFAAVAVTQQYIKGKATEEERAVACKAAYDAACDTAYNVVDSTGRRAVFNAASESACRAASCAQNNSVSRAAYICRAVYKAAYSIACIAEGTTAREEQNALLTSMLMTAYVAKTGSRERILS